MPLDQVLNLPVIVFAASISGAGFPVVAKKVKWMKIPPSAFFFCKHFGTGVLIATAFVHVGMHTLIATHVLIVVAFTNGVSITQRPVVTRCLHGEVSCHAWCDHDGFALLFVRH